MSDLTSQWAQLGRWLAPPVFANDEEKTRQAALVNLIGLACIFFNLAVIVGNALGGSTPALTQAIDLVACGVLLQFLRWVRQGQVYRARLGLVIFGLIYLIATTASLGGIQTPTTAIFVFWVLMTGVLFERDGLLLATVAASLAILGLIVAENAGWLAPPVRGADVSNWVTYTALFIFTSRLSFAINQEMNGALAHARTEVRQRRQAEAQLHAAKNKLQGMIDAIPDLLFEIGGDGVIHDYRSPRSDLLAAPPEVFLGKKLAEFLPPEASHRVQGALHEAARTGISTGTTYALALPQGEHWFELSVAVKPGGAAQDPRFICLSRDVTRRQQAEESLRVSEARHRLLAENARDVIWSMNLDGVMTYVSPSVQTVRGFTPAEVTQQSVQEQFVPASRVVWLAYVTQLHADHAAGRPPESFRGELECLCKDGSTVWTEVMAHPLFSDQGLVEFTGVLRDITEHKRLVCELQQAHAAAQAAQLALQRANDELSRIAVTDPLTGLWNRRHFVQVAETEAAQARRYHQPLSMLIFDIDHFKLINDHFGHPTGDRVLIALSQLVSGALRQGDVLARWGGEEFVVVLPHCGQSEAMLLAEKLRALVAAHPFAEVGCVTVSLGVAEFRPDELPEAWFKRVDLALYAAKSGGRNTTRLAG